MGGTNVLPEPYVGDFPAPTLSHPSVATTSTLVLAANAKRIFASFQDNSDTEMTLAEGQAAVIAETHPVLKPNGGYYEMSPAFKNLYCGAIYAIHGGSGGKVLLVKEGSIP